MATCNTNFKAVRLVAGNAYTLADLGDGLSASTVHQVFCVSGGTITLTALGGGTFTWAATTGQSIDITLGSCSATTGSLNGKRLLVKNNYQLKSYEYFEHRRCKESYW